MQRPVDLRLGIDVGGTHTDAVVMDRFDRLVSKAKVTTTTNPSDGIHAAVGAVLATGDSRRGRITHAMLGTTHATNAVLRRQGLGRVAVVRIAGPASHSIPPLTGWPDDLRTAVSAGEVVVDGQIEYDGREDVPLDVAALRKFLEGLREPVDAVAVTGVFSPVSDLHEQQATEVIRDVVGDVPVVLSSAMGTIGILDRENSTVLNGALINVIKDVAAGFIGSLDAHGISAECFFAQNDGTLMSVDYVTEHPVLTIGSGPANSLRGAAFLAGMSEALVVDIGGTSADVGALVGGFPRQSSLPVDVGGVQTNFRMPDLLALAVGGGSLVAQDGDTVRIGPDSVGKDLPQRGLCFGGDTTTLTDAGVVVGRGVVGDHDPAEHLSHSAAEAAIRTSDAALREAIDRMKLTKQDEPLIVVGGGSFLLPDTLPGVGTVHRPDHHEVANAVGAAIATVSATVDKLYPLEGRNRADILEEAQQEALGGVVRLGGEPSEASIVEVDEIQLSYLATPVIRVRIKAAAPLAGLRGAVTTDVSTSP